MLVFEIDPIMVIDEIIQFLISPNPTIIKNTNIHLTEYSLKIINNIIDSINKFFDYDNQIIKNLEIVEIIYMKFINCCYINESQKKDSGLMLLKILLQKFDKIINYKYLKYFFKCISSVTSNYLNIVKIQFKKGSNNLVEIVDYLIKMFALNDENYYKLNEEYLKDDKNINDDMLSDKEKEVIINAKKNFIMFFDFIKYCFDEIVEKIDSSNNYTRSLGIYLINGVIGNFPQLKKIIPILFQIDISNINIFDFYQYFKEAIAPIEYRSLISICNNKIYKNINNIKNNALNSKNKKYILNKFNSTKIYKKIDTILNSLTRKLGIRETNFENLITNSDSLNNIFNFCPFLIEEYIFYDNNKNINLCLEVIKAIYFNLLISYFTFLEISQNFKEKEVIKTKFNFLFLEQILSNKTIEHNFKFKNKNGQEIILINEVEENKIEFIEQYIYDNEIFRNVVNIREYFYGELFELIGLKLIMGQQYIKLLKNIFYRLDFDNINEDKKKEIYKYKIKATKLVFNSIFNLTSSLIIKECSSFLYNIFKNDSKLEEIIYKENYNKINSLINKINDINIRDSNCGISQDINTGLQKIHINSLLMICKSMQLDENMLFELSKKINIFQNFAEHKYENSQFILFYGYISLFLYIDIKEENIKIIFKQLLYRIKESIIYFSKNFLSFTQTKYNKKIIKLITKYRHCFSKFIIDMYENKNDKKYISKLIKIIVMEERSVIICEAIMDDITNKIKNEIIINKNNQNEEEIKININKLVYYLKICKIISWIYPINLKRTSLIEIIDEYIKKLIINYDKNYEKFQENIDYEKIMKYWLDLNKLYIDYFNKKNKYLLSLFFFKSLENVSKYEKNKILQFLSYHLILIANENNFVKIFKNIINEFIQFYNILLI